MKKYKPIPCDFHSLLEDAAVRKKIVTFEIQEGKDTVLKKVKVIDLFTLKGEEFMILDSGEKIRLDEVLKMDGFRMSDFNCRF